MNRNTTVPPFCAVAQIDAQTVELTLNGYIVPPGWADGELYHSAQTFIDEFKKIDGKYATININIGALYGGSVYEGNVIFNTIENSKSVVNTHVTGLAASMGYQIFLAGTNRTMNETAQLMAHKAWTLVIGNADDMRKEALNMDKIDNNIKLVTKARSNRTDAQIEEMFSTDTFITAAEAQEYGMATAVIPLKNSDSNTKDPSNTLDKKNMMSFLKNGFMGGLFPNNSNKPNNAMTQEEIDKKVADAVAAAEAKKDVEHQAAITAKDEEIAALKPPAAEKKPEGAAPDATAAALQKLTEAIAGLTSKNEALEAKLEKMEKQTDDEPPLGKKDGVTPSAQGGKGEKLATDDWAENL